MARSISPGSARQLELLTPSDGDARAWIAAYWPIPAGSKESRTTATRVRLGASSLSSSSHFPLRLYSNALNPVESPHRRPRQAFATNPAPTGSMTLRKHDRHAAGNPLQRRHNRTYRSKNDVRRKRYQFRRGFSRVSGISAPSGYRCARCVRRSSLTAAARPRMRGREPALPDRSSDIDISTPMRRFGSYARAAIDHATEALPISVMNSRRLMGSPSFEDHHITFGG